MHQQSQQFSKDKILSKKRWHKVKPIFRSLIIPILAVMIAYFAQYVLTGNNGTQWMWIPSLSSNQRLLVSLGLYLLAIILWIYFPPKIKPKVEEYKQEIKIIPANPPHRKLPLYWLILSGVTYLLNNLFFALYGENTIIRILWFLSLVIFLFSLSSWSDQSPKQITDDGKSPPFHLENWLILGLILAFSFWLRSYQLAIIPDDFHGDMASHGIQARDLLLGAEQNIFKFGWANIPMFGFLPAFFSMSIFGNNLYGLQMTSVIGGTISILAVYLLVWRLFDNHRLATITSVLVAINIPHLHFSRIAEYIDPWPLGFLALFFLIDGIRSKGWLSFGLSGVLIGFSSLMYYSGRVIPIIITFFFLYFLFDKKSWIYKRPYSILILIMGIVLACGPAIINIFLNLEPFLSRSSQVFLFDPGVMLHLLNKYEVNSELKVILRQTQETLLMFNKVGDSSTQFGYRGPMFNSFVSPLLILGVGSALRRKKEIGVVLTIIWIVLIMGLGSVLTVDAPAWPRLVGIIPAGALLAALAIEQLYNLVKNYTGHYVQRILLILFVLWIATIGWINWDHYYQSVKTNASSVAFLGRYIQQLPEDVTVCGFLVDPPLNVREINFLGWPRKLVDFSPDAPIEDLRSCDGPSLVWVLKPEHTDRLQDLYHYWPEGELITYESRYKIFTYIFYLTGETLPTLMPQDIMEKDLDSYRWMYSIVLAGLILVGFIIWVVLRNERVRSFWNKFLCFYLKRKNNFFVDRKIQKIIRAFKTKLWKNTKIQTVCLKFCHKTSKFIKELKDFFHPKQFKKMNKKIIWDLLTFLLPIALAYSGQMILNAGRDDSFTFEILREIHFTENQRLIVAGIIFLVSGIIWVMRIKSFQCDPRGISEHKKHSSKPSVKIRHKNKKLMKMFLYDILLFMAISMITYLIQGENPIVRWFWMIALVGFLIYLVLQKTQKEKWNVDPSPGFKNAHKWLLGMLLVIAFLLRIYRLYDIPLDLSTDMASMGISARDYLLGNESQIFGTGWYYIPRLAFLPYVFSMWLAGNDLFGLYFGTVVMGTLSILAVYLLIWRLFDNHRLALITIILITINPAHIEYSRIPSYIDPWMFGFFSLFLLIDGLKSRRKTSFAFSGILAAFTFMGYPSGRAIIPMMGLVILSAFLFKREWIKENYFGLIWLTGSFLFALGPNLIYILKDWGTFMKRADEVFVFSAYNHVHVRYSYETNSVLVIMWEQIKRTLFSFNFYNDKSPQFSYPHPIFNPIIAPLMVLGFFQALWKWKQPGYLIIVSSFLFVMVTGGILTIDTPTWCRLLPAILLGAFFIAIVLEKILTYANSFSKKLISLFVILTLVGFIITLGIKDWNQYISYVAKETRPVVFVGRFIDPLPDDINVCAMTDGYNIFWSETAFLGWPHTMIEVSADISQISKEDCPGEKLVWIISPAYKMRLEEIKEIWPNGAMMEHYKYNKEFLFISYLVDNPSLP